MGPPALMWRRGTPVMAHSPEIILISRVSAEELVGG